MSHYDNLVPENDLAPENNFVSKNIFVSENNPVAENKALGSCLKAYISQLFGKEEIH